MAETGQITDKDMDEFGYDAAGQYHAYPHSNILGNCRNSSEMPNDLRGLFAGVRNAFAIEIFGALILWGLWELHHPIMFLAHWLVSHAH